MYYQHLLKYYITISKISLNDLIVGPNIIPFLRILKILIPKQTGAPQKLYRGDKKHVIENKSIKKIVQTK